MDKKYYLNQLSIPNTNLKIYVVDGTYVRENLHMDFIAGGHHYVYDFIPKDEIWLDHELDTHELFPTLLHELYERWMMKNLESEYDMAHEEANEVELEYRKQDNPDALAKAIEELVSIS